MKNLKSILSIGVLALAMGAGAGTAKAETTTPTAGDIKTQVQQLRDQGKETREANKQKLVSDKQQMEAIFKEYQGKIQTLKTQRDAAVKAGNKDQAKSLTDQIQALKTERQGKMKTARETFKADRAKAKQDKHAFRQQVKDLRAQKKA